MPPPDTAVVPPKLAAFSRTRTERPAFAARIAAVSPDAPDPTTITSYCISLVSIGGLRRFHDCLHLFARPADLTGDIERIPIFAPPDNFVVIIQDRKRVVKGKGVSVRLNHGGRRNIK